MAETGSGNPTPRRTGTKRTTRVTPDPAHASGKRRMGPVPKVNEPHLQHAAEPRHQRWVATSGRVGRTRRSPRG